ncbi:PXA domain-containing protein [Halteromyces radiatus]|uniref:PXA domain-containing protein n=1 Tax=Halteromyces radiatus TaxID=101107 RepID=UPI0022202FD9|nr:PXA domain-containing protein [Halteromyces radiatus]KAI8092564.1 PXA domain-containing protein [Halteromyces radiatus]
MLLAIYPKITRLHHPTWYSQFMGFINSQLTNSINKLDLEDFHPLRFSQKFAWSRLQQQRLQENDSSSTSPLCSDNDVISNTFNELVSYIIRDFIQSWFNNVSPPNEQSFPLSVDHIIRSAAFALKRRLEQVDTMSVLLNRLVPRITAHISEFRAAEVALRGRFLERSVTESDELDLLLASHYSGGKLHPALTTSAATTKPTEVAYLRQVVDRILPKLLDADQVNCAPVRVIVREITTCALLQPIMNMLADPDFWNQTIDTQLGMALREQKMVRQLREVLDRHSNDMDTLNEYIESDSSNLLNPTTPSSSSSKQYRKMGPISQFSSAFLGMDIDDDVAWDDQDFDPEKTTKRQNFGSSRMGRRTFQEFLKRIEEEKNLLDLKRLRNDVVTQIRKKKALILDRDPEEVIDGEKVEDLIVYVNRLSVAKKRVDKRIATLSGEHVDFKTSASQFFGVRRQRPKQISLSSGFTLQDILTNTAGLSYFMEFMDRRGDMVKLQFWLIVEGFKSSDDDETRQDDQTFLQDVKMVYDMYFAATSPHRLSITDHLEKDLLQSIQYAQQIMRDGGTNNLQYSQAIKDMRQQLYRIQQHLLWQLEKEHFPYFKRSDLYFKFLASTPTPETVVPGRRSLDDTTLYRRSCSESNQKADSDTEISTREKKRPSISISASDGQDNSMSPSHSSKSSSLQQIGHSRTLSDNIISPVTDRSGTSKFLSFGRVFDSANEWWRATDFGNSTHQQQQQTQQSRTTTGSIKRNSVHGSLKSTDTEYPDTDEELSHSVTTLDEDQHGTPPPSEQPRQLIRRNTVDAVEAELQSIIDGKENNGNNTKESCSPITTSPISATLRPRSSSGSASLRRSPNVFIGGSSVDIKSSTADPVQVANPTTSWESSRENKPISQMIQDQLENTTTSYRTTANKSNKQKIATITETDNTITNVHLAPPGDLMLADKVHKLSDEMEKLIQQEAIVDVLIKKAEAKDKIEELRILLKSKNMFRRELEQMQYQKNQYELQESENVLTPDRTRVSITSSTIGSDQHGDFALYVIEIQQIGFDGNYASGWIVARRYSEFFGLHQTLKATYPSVKMIDFPSKWPLLKLQKSFVEARRINLERYLRRLLAQPDICQSEALRVFLSQQNIYVPGPRQPSPSNSFYQEAVISPFGFLPFIPSAFYGSDQSTSSVIPQTSSSSSSVASNTSPTGYHPYQRSSSEKMIHSLPNDLSRSSNLNDKKSKGFMRHIYNTVAAGIDDMFVTPSMLDLITQRLGEQVMGFSNDDNDMVIQEQQQQQQQHILTAGSSSPSTPPSSSGSTSRYYKKSTVVDEEVSSSDLMDDTMQTTAAGTALGSELKPVDVEGMTRFTEPLCDLFIEMFELKEKNNWLRRQAVVIILQQILGGTIERKLRDTIKYLETESMVVFYFRKIMDSLWPNGSKLTFKPARKPEEKQQTKEEANRKLSTWLPDLLGNMVGRQNARKGARRLFSVLQNQRLNQHLVYILLDEIVLALFPDLDAMRSTTSGHLV